MSLPAIHLPLLLQKKTCSHFQSQKLEMVIYWNSNIVIHFWKPTIWSDLLRTRDCNSSLCCHDRDLYRDDLLPSAFQEVGLRSAHTQLHHKYSCNYFPQVPHHPCCYLEQDLTHKFPSSWTTQILSFRILFHLGHKPINISKSHGYGTSSAY